MKIKEWIEILKILDLITNTGEYQNKYDWRKKIDLKKRNRKYIIKRNRN